MNQRKFKLTGKSLKGKNRVRENGETWELVEKRQKVLFSTEDGPWLLLSSIANPSHSRWVHEHHDTDFVVLEETTDEHPDHLH